MGLTREITQAVIALCEANLLLQKFDERCSLMQVQDFFLDSKFRELVVKETFDPTNGSFEILSDRARKDYIRPILEIASKWETSKILPGPLSANQNLLDFKQIIKETLLF
jgi:hypothetical protein